MSAFNKPDEVLATGIRLAGQKFFALSANDRSIYGKKAVRIPTQSFFGLLLSCAYTFHICYTPFLADCVLVLMRSLQGDGCVLVKTKQAVLVAEYTAPTQAPEATPVVEGLADYLINVGY